MKAQLIIATGLWCVPFQPWISRIDHGKIGKGYQKVCEIYAICGWNCLEKWPKWLLPDPVSLQGNRI